MNENTKRPSMGNQFFEEEKPIEIVEILADYLRYWKWFVVGVTVALFFSMVYLKLNKPVYRAAASVILEDEKSKSPGGNSDSFIDMSILNGLGTSSIENELGLIRSKRLMASAVRALGLNVEYYQENGFSLKEVYHESPYKLRLIRIDEQALGVAMEEETNVLKLSKVDRNTVNIEAVEGEYEGTYKIGEIVEMGFADFIVESNKGLDTLARADDDSEARVQVRFLHVDQVAASLSSGFMVALLDKNSTLIELSIEGTIQKKIEDILDQLIFEYNQEAIEDKNLIARNTAFFIDERLSIINSELDSVETGKEKFKTANQLTNIEAESSIIIQNVSDYNNKQQEVLTELEMTKAMLKHVNANKLNLLPANMGGTSSGMVQLVEEYNKLVLERNRMLQGATENNPLVVDLGTQLQDIKDNISESLKSKRSNLMITKDNLSRQAGILGSQISAVPSQERQFRDIERQQNIKEALYLFLLQKREENSLSLATKSPKAKIVDKAYSLGAPISPNKRKVMGVALFIGLVIPFLIINFKKFVNNKINNRDELKDVARGTAVVGEIPHVLASGSTVVSLNERSALSESFSILAANLNYVIPDKAVSRTGSCIYVTSSTQGEGKTFTVINLALILAESGKRVVMVGADLRNPQLHRHENKPLSANGLSTYLASTNTELSNYLEDSSLNKNLKVLPSGPVTPNPIQLLGKDKMGEMLEELKADFDYVIVDTAPAMILADTFLISKYADLTLYLVRAGQTEKKVLDFALEAKADGKLKNMAFILNDVKIVDATYGSKYGYTYGNDKANK